MPPLRGFSDNTFRDRNDLIIATRALVQALDPYLSPGQARVRLPVLSGVHFDETAADLEGFARPLWAIAAVAAAPSSIGDAVLDTYAERLVTGLANGVNPSSLEFWGTIGDWDQRMVEAEPISFALLLAPSRFYEPLSAQSRTHLSEWLSGLNGKVMPDNNWRWFRIFSNLARHRICGVRFEEVKECIDADFALLDRFYLGNGWSADGIWRDDSGCDRERYGRQADYYSGSFAIQFSQLLYCVLAADSDPQRIARYLEQAREFASQFWRFFDADGASIPFGRSLTYRFAMGAFYAAFALAEAYDMSNPYTTPGFVKGMLLRHLRWWAAHSEHIFAVDGTLTIGYLYPNMFMCEDYNSPQSPYWAMKSFVVLALADNDKFWAAEELLHPFARLSGGHFHESGVHLLEAPSQILCDHPEGQHHFMLSGGQFCLWPLKATQAKYSKFAYSSAFGFSVPTGPLLTQLAPDSTLAISRNGAETWAVRWEIIGNVRVQTFFHNDNQITCLQSVWKPWKTCDITVRTTLVPPTNEWPDWHIRIHRVRAPPSHSAVSETLRLVEGGFAMRVEKPNHRPNSLGIRKVEEDIDRTLEDSTGALAIGKIGSSGVRSLFASKGRLEGKIQKSDPNTNLMEARALIPTIQHEVQIQPGEEVVIAVAVFAIAAGKVELSHAKVLCRWNRQPQVRESGLCFTSF